MEGAKNLSAGDVGFSLSHTHQALAGFVEPADVMYYTRKHEAIWKAA